MNYIEADNFLENEVRGRFSKWKPESAEIRDWLFFIKGMDWDVALRAIREHKSESRYNAPALSTFRAKACNFAPPKEQVAVPEDAVFVMYEGGGRGPLQAGFFFPVIVQPHEQHLLGKAAENVRRHHAERYGGEWKVYSPTTPVAMAKMRQGIRAAIIEGQG